MDLKLNVSKKKISFSMNSKLGKGERIFVEKLRDGKVKFVAYKMKKKVIEWKI